MFVGFAPAIAYKSADKQKQGRLRLVEIGDHCIDNLIFIARSYYYARAGDKSILSAAVKPFSQCLKSLVCRHIHIVFVG